MGFLPLPAKEAPGRRDARRVLECLQRSLKIADVCIAGGVNAQLFIEILNHYVYFFEADNPEVRCGAPLTVCMLKLVDILSLGMMTLCLFA